ncbi:MAG: hypothetical protein AUG49_13070 [Catenulispora sp. 13_1_20CM_3_70_7]|nr:MAG: hypothetical protein AUG49_13070 [Catenulispora sp. 13_1_20CM_3_70_7]
MNHHDVSEEPSGEQYLAELQQRLDLAGQAIGFHIDLGGQAGPIEHVTDLAGAIAAYLDALSQRPELFTHRSFLDWTSSSYIWAVGEILPATLIRAALTYRLQVLCRVIQPPELPAADPLTGAAVAAMRAAVEILAASVTSGTGHRDHHLRSAATHLVDATAHLDEASRPAAP